MEQLHFTRDQVSKILDQIVQEGGGVQELFKLALESIMRAERELHNEKNSDVSNGFRLRKTFGKGKLLELRVPRSRYGHFYPVLLGLLKDQEEECRRMAFSLYGAGLTTLQVKEIFEDLYGRDYSTSQISRLFNYAREEVNQWLNRPLDTYYPILMIDATFIPTRREDSVSKEAYYTILGVKADRTREVLAIVNFPTESASAWQEVFENIKRRGVNKVGLVVCDALAEIETAIWAVFPKVDVQLCVVHLQRNLNTRYIKPKHRAEVSAELKDIFRKADKSYTKQKALRAWELFCAKWGKYYPILLKKAKEERMELYFTYLNYDYRIQSMIYSTNWIERLNRDYKNTTSVRGALPNADATILLLGHVAMTRKAYERKVPMLKNENEKFKWED